jgi:hypothetical protein
MKNLVNITLFTLTMLSALSPASAQSEICQHISNEPAHVAEGTVIDHEGDAQAEAEQRAVDVATAYCADSGEGSPLVVGVSTRESGVVATSTVRFFCSDSC